MVIKHSWIPRSAGRFQFFSTLQFKNTEINGTYFSKERPNKKGVKKEIDLCGLNTGTQRYLGDFSLDIAGEF